MMEWEDHPKEVTFKLRGGLKDEKKTRKAKYKSGVGRAFQGKKILCEDPEGVKNMAYLRNQKKAHVTEVRDWQLFSVGSTVSVMVKRGILELDS